MPIDLTQIESGEDFEFLCQDLLQALGFTIETQVARGPDLGKDIIATQMVRDGVGFAETHRYLIECKHYAKSGKSVQERDIGSPVARMGNHNCNRYILATSTVPSEKVRAQLAGIPNAVPGYRATTWSKGDLIRLLDEHPDVRDRYFPPEEAEPPTPAGRLSETVEGLLTVMGFACQSREATADRVRLICTSKGAFARSVAVVCREGTVERGDVDALIAGVQAHDLGGGVLVTHTRVSPAARERSAETGDAVRAFTLDEFYRELIDFEPYVRELVADYEDDELSTYYVDLGCRSADGSVYKPLDDYVDAWLDDPARTLVPILGDYGTGKTSFCRQYAAKLGRRWLADPDRLRIPILISLRDYAKAMNLEQLVTDFLVNRCGIQAGYSAFHRFNADGKLILLFDAFDEMAQNVDYQTTVENFEELSRAVEGRSKVILTCRTSYFRTSREAEELLSYRGAELPAEISDPLDRAVIDLTGRPYLEIVYLLPFDRTDIQTMLRARSPDDWETHWQQIERTYNLEELTQRPVLLDMIARSLPELMTGQTINAARLYETYTDLWLARDEEKGRTLITHDDKRLFMQELALGTLRREELSIHYSRLPERVREHFCLEKADEIDYFAHDIRTCSFLNRDPEGNYCFVHKSFQEFFVAQWLAPRLLDATAPEMTINEEIRGFVHGLLMDADWPLPPPEGMQVPEGMVWVPPGLFIMGGPYRFPVQVARIEEGFFVARAPVTNGEYARFVEATGREPPQHWKGKTPPDELRDHPVVYVSWHDSVAYAEWAGMRLLAEQEWEKAARGIDGRIYPWGDEFDPKRCNTDESGIGTTTPVGQYSPDGDSPCGCVDMAGNVWEWTVSEWGSETARRVLCGGSFLGGQRLARASFRLGDDPQGRLRLDGFRVAVAPFSLPARSRA